MFQSCAGPTSLKKRCVVCVCVYVCVADTPLWAQGRPLGGLPGGCPPGEGARPGWGRGREERPRRRARAAACPAASAESHVLLPGGGVKGGGGSQGSRCPLLPPPPLHPSPQRGRRERACLNEGRATPRVATWPGAPGRGSACGSRPRPACSCGPRWVSTSGSAGTLRAARRGRWERWGRRGVGAGSLGTGSTVGVGVAALALLPPPPCWYGRFLILCSRRCRPEPGARERPSPGRHPARGGSRGAASDRRCPACAGSERLRGCWEGE